MQSALAEWLGIDPEWFHWVVVPLLIFLARITDVSVSTMRIMLMMSGRKTLATSLGFFESLIWLIAISQILQNVSSWISYVAYAGGFATGIFVGMRIEERLALGNVIVRVVTQLDASALVEALIDAGYRVTNVAATGARGRVNLLFTVVDRRKLTELKALIRKFNPQAFYTVENVRYVSETDALGELAEAVPDPPGQSFWRRLRRQ